MQKTMIGVASVVLSAVFLGVHPPLSTAQDNGEPVKIGVLVPASDAHAAAGQAVQQGTALAIAEANQAGGFAGRPFELIVRTMEGAWGSGAREIVQMAWQDSVWAILGTVDGRSAHLVEQVILKRRVVFLTPWVTDPTLAQINLPWFFRSVPDDGQQAAALVEAAYAGRARIATLAGPGYDARLAEQALHEAATEAGRTLVGRFTVDDERTALRPVLDRLQAAKPEGVVLFGHPEAAARWLRAMQEAGFSQPVFGPVALRQGVFLKAARTYPEAVILVTLGKDVAAASAFHAAYRAAYGMAPHPAAAYAYDGTRAVLEAIRRGGLDRDALRDALAGLVLSDGVTGSVAFDAQGNRRGVVTTVANR